MGTPQTRCREMHQSGRVAIMLCMRSLPHAGSHFTFSMSSRVAAAEGASALHGGFHGNEPLLGGAKDDGIVAAPAVRIRVLELFGMQQRAALLQQFDDGRIGVENLQPSYSGSPLRMMPASSTLLVASRPYFDAGSEVVGAVRGAVWTTPVPVSMVT